MHTFSEIIRRLVLSSEKATAKRRVRNYCNAQLSASLQESNVRVFDDSAEWGIFNLHSVDVVDFASTADRLAGDFRKAKVLDFPLFFQLYHCLDSLLNWCLLVHSMAVVEVYFVDLEPLQTLGASFLDVLRGAINHDTYTRRASIAKLLLCEPYGYWTLDLRPMAYLCGQEDLAPLPSPLEPFSNQIFAVAVHVCAVPICLTKLIGTVEYLEPQLVRLGFSIKRGETHGTKAQGSDLRTIFTELSGGELR